MSFVRSRVFAALLLAVWLAALDHCGLEAAGFFGGATATEESSCCDETRCLADACSVIEDASFTHEDGGYSLLPPSDAGALLGWILSPELADLTPAPEDRARPPDCGRQLAHVVGWRFTQRAALPPGAPSTLG